MLYVIAALLYVSSSLHQHTMHSYVARTVTLEFQAQFSVFLMLDHGN